MRWRNGAGRGSIKFFTLEAELGRNIAMKICFSRPAGMLCKALLAGALFSLASFAQTSAPQKSKARAPEASSSQKKPAASAASSPQEVVMTVGNIKVTKAEMEFVMKALSPQQQQVVATRGNSFLARQYSLMLLLSQKAVSDHLDVSPDIHRAIELQKHQLLAQAEYEHLQSQAKIGPEEVSAYYASHKQDFEEASIREFIVRKKAEDAKPGSAGLSPEDARARLDSIRKAIVAGTSIDQVEKKFSVPDVVVVEPTPRTVRKGEMIPALDEAAFKLKDNQFSDPVETPQAMVVLQVVSHQETPLKDVSPEIESNLREQKASKEVNDLRTNARIWMNPDYFKPPSAPQPSGTAPAHGVPGASGSVPAPAPQKPAHP
jgi:PPIC-type PPIASE domain